MIINILNNFFFSEKWNNSLSGLMSHFTESHGKYIMPGSPIIELTTNSDELNGRFFLYSLILFK